MDKQKEFMDKAARLSREAIDKYDGGPFGCIIVKDSEIVGQGWNYVMATNDPTAHAEVMAIRDACKNLGTPELVNCEIYSSAEPCPMCLAAIYWACIGKIYYANTKEDSAAMGYEDSIIYEEFKKPVKERKIPMIHIEDEEAAKVFRDWKKKNMPADE